MAIFNSYVKLPEGIYGSWHIYIPSKWLWPSYIPLIIYPLVNCHIIMEHHHAINGQINYFYGHFLIAFCMFTKGYPMDCIPLISHFYPTSIPLIIYPMISHDMFNIFVLSGWRSTDRWTRVAAKWLDRSGHCTSTSPLDLGDGGSDRRYHWRYG